MCLLLCVPLEVDTPLCLCCSTLAACFRCFFS
jgi:hypothetical protein